MSDRSGALRVLHVNLSGARNRLLIAQIDHSPQLDWHVATLGPAGPLGRDLAERGVEYSALDVNDPRMVPIAAARVRRLLAHVRPDVVHVHLLWPSVAVELARTSMAGPPPVVHTRHHNRSHHRGHPVHRRLDVWIAKRAAATVAISTAVRQTLVDVESVPADRVTVVHNGIDGQALAASSGGDRWRQRLLASPSQRLAVAVGRIDPEKDYPTLISAFQLVRERHPDTVLAIAGTGPVESLQRLHELLSTLGLEAAVHVLGWVDDLFDLVSAADVFVQASLDEALGQSITEAMMLGIPVAVTTPGGVVDVVGDSHPPIEPRDSAALAERIKTILDDPGAAREDARGMVPQIARRFDPAEFARKHIEIYERVAAGDRRRARPQPIVHRCAGWLARRGVRGAAYYWRLADAVAARPSTRFARTGDGLAPTDRADWSADAWYRGLYERSEREVVGRILPRGGVAVDVGANLGQYTLLCASLLGSSGRVIACEPSPRCREVLMEGIELAGFGNVDVLPVAVSSRVGVGVFRDAGGADHSGLGTLRENVGSRRVEEFEVDIRTLDSILAAVPYVDLLKVDVEGLEAEVLAGAASTLRRAAVGSILLEVSPGFGPVDYAADLIASMADSHRAFVVTEKGFLRRVPRLTEVGPRDIPLCDRQFNLLLHPLDDCSRLGDLVSRPRSRG